MSRIPLHLRILGVGFLLVLAGMVFPFLIVLQVLPSTFWLNFLSFAMSVSGLILGLVGSAYYVAAHRKRDD
jgi:hypothetical protein